LDSKWSISEKFEFFKNGESSSVSFTASTQLKFKHQCHLSYSHHNSFFLDYQHQHISFSQFQNSKMSEYDNSLLQNMDTSPSQNNVMNISGQNTLVSNGIPLNYQIALVSDTINAFSEKYFFDITNSYAQRCIDTLDMLHKRKDNHSSLNCDLDASGFLILLKKVDHIVKFRFVLPELCIIRTALSLSKPTHISAAVSIAIDNLAILTRSCQTIKNALVTNVLDQVYKRTNSPPTPFQARGQALLICKQAHEQQYHLFNVADDSVGARPTQC
jgi:hypothetical protein